jgi:hypothetical protein
VSGKGIDTPLHADILYFLRRDSMLANADKVMGGVLENLDSKTVIECSHILHKERYLEFTLGFG